MKLKPGGGIMPQRLKFFALFAVISLFPLGFAKDYDKGDKEKKSVDFEMDGSIRYRYEYWQQHPFMWDASAFPGFFFFDSDLFNHNYTNWHLLRSRIGVKASLNEDKFAYIQFQDSRHFGGDASLGYQGSSGMTPDIHNYGINNIFFSDAASSFGVTQAYLQVNRLWNSPLGLKIGRQFLEYDNQKLVGSDDWSQFGQSFDAIKLMFRHEYFDGDFFYSQLFPYYPLDDIYQNINFFGFHGTVKYHQDHNLSAYLFGYRDGSTGVFDPNEDAALADPTAKTMQWTLGAHGEGNTGFGLGYSADAAFQFGKFYGFDVSAFMFELEAWYKLKDLKAQPYFGASFTYASGDDSADGDKNTFVRLFPSPHKHLGYMDLVGMQNILSFGLMAGVSPITDLSLHAAFHFFFLNDTSDAWYNDYGYRFDVPFGPTPGRGIGFAEKNLGQEFDFALKYKYDGGLWFKAGWSHFFTGGALENLDNGTPVDLEDPNWIYLQTGLDF